MKEAAKALGVVPQTVYIKFRADKKPDAEVQQLWFDKSISDKEAVKRAGPGWSKATMHRRFGLDPDEMCSTSVRNT